MKLIEIYRRLAEESIDTTDYNNMSDSEKRQILRKLYPLVDAEINKVPTLISNHDRDTINAAKLIAKKYKIPYQHLLQGRRPSGTLNQPVWDTDGKIVPWKKVFGR